MAHHLTDAQRDALGYVGGSVLAICLVPQVAKVLMTRSARDISISWSLLYATGTVLTLAYLILKDALAAWIPLIFEIAGCLLVLFLKIFFEYTATGRRYSAAKRQELTLPLHSSPAGQDARAGSGSSHGLAVLGQAAAAAVSSSGDISWRGRAVLGQQQEAPSGLVVPMIDCSVHGGSRHGGSRHGTDQGDASIRYGGHALAAAGTAAAAAAETRPEPAVAVCKDTGLDAVSKAGTSAAQQDAVLEVTCTGTSLGSCSNSSASLVQEGSRAGPTPRSQQVQPSMQVHFAAGSSQGRTSQ